MNKKCNPLRNVLSVPSQQNHNFHRAAFTKAINSQFQDTSMKKVQHDKTAQQKHLQNLNKTQEIIIKSHEYHKSLDNRIDNYYKAFIDYKEQVEASEKLEIKLHFSAIKIQKVIRGFLCRKHIEAEWVTMKKEKLIKFVKEIEDSQKDYLYKVGRLPEIAAITLQRAFRRAFFYNKIIRICKTYKMLLMQKEMETYRKIRSILSILRSQMHIRHLKREKMVQNKLKAIKRKLALLSIKIIFKRERISWKIVKLRIKKFKRNLKLPANKSKIRRGSMRDSVTFDSSPIERLKIEIISEKQTSKDPSPLHLPETISKDHLDPNLLKVNPTKEDLHSCSSQESILTTTTEKESFLRAEMLKRFEEERQVKIALGKISYNVRDKDESRLLPYLRIATIPNYDMRKNLHNKSPVSLIKNNLHEKAPEVFDETKAKSAMPSKTKKKYLIGSYMRETVSYQLSRVDAPDLNIEENPQRVYGKVRPNSTLMIPTTAFRQKILGNPSARSHSTETKTGEKIELPKNRFASIAHLSLPQTNPQPKRIPIIVMNSPKLEIPEQRITEIEESNRFSLSFCDALPEFSGFLTQYARSPRKAKLEPIAMKGNKLQEILDL